MAVSFSERTSSAKKRCASRTVRAATASIGPVADPHIARLPPQPGAVALRTRQVPTVAAQEHSDVNLVFLPLQPAEEALHPFVSTPACQVSFDDELFLLIGQLRSTGRRSARRAACAARFNSASCAR